MAICTFKMPTIRQVWQLIQQGNYAFSIDVKDADLHIPFFNHHHHFCTFCLATQTLSVADLGFGLAMIPKVFTTLTKPILFLAIAKVFFFGYCLFWMISWSLLLSVLARQLEPSFLCIGSLGLHIFSKPDLNLMKQFLTVLEYGAHVCLYCLTSLLRWSSWYMLCFRGNLLQSVRFFPFWQEHLPKDMHSFVGCAVSFTVIC